MSLIGKTEMNLKLSGKSPPIDTDSPCQNLFAEIHTNHPEQMSGHSQH